MMPHRTVRGRINYTSNKPDRIGADRGREWFTFTFHADGSYVLRAQCEIDEPDPCVLRDVIAYFGPKDEPRSAYVHLMVGDAWMGSGWFNADYRGGLVECESDSPALGRISQRHPFQEKIDGFSTHPLVGDGQLTRYVDVSKGPHRATIRPFLPSPDHRGATAPIAAEVRIGLEYVGDEDVTVVAGTFACRHFRFVDDQQNAVDREAYPAYEIWVTADDDAIFVKGGVGGYMQTCYELVELER